MIKDYDLVSWDKFNPHKLDFKRKAGTNPIYVSKEFVSLDTETSKYIEKQHLDAWLYQWCFSYPAQPPLIKRQLVYGRKPSELAEVLMKIKNVNSLSNIKSLNIFIHNLSYDYCYIKDYIEKVFGHKGNVIEVGSHQVICYNIDGLNFRCSFRLSQKSLDAWGRELGIKHRKLKGTVDYDKVRYQDSKLTRKDWKYMFYDVVCLDEAIVKNNEQWGDDMTTIPLTLTGYVRRECYKYFQSSTSYRNSFKSQALDATTFSMCKRQFAGGLTHGNRFFGSKTIRVNEDGTITVNGITKRRGKWYIRHRDFVSHYPSQQKTGYAPMSKFVCYYDNTKGNEEFFSWSELVKLAESKCILAAVAIKDLELKKGVTLPVAQSSKFRDGAIEDISLIEDNGRILKMEKGKSLIVINEYDMKWLQKQYTFNYQIITVYTATRGRFPKYITDTIDEFFYKKSYYKTIEKRMDEENISKNSSEYIENHLNMMIAKGMLNSIYGMSATCPIREYYYEDENGNWQWKSINDMTNEDLDNALKEYYSKHRSFMNWELGCWTTSLARNELLGFVELIGYDNFIYADTDSIFYISNDEIEAKIEAKNTKFREINDKNGWFCEVDGKRIYYNQFELEKEEIVAFRFLHSKCYAYEVQKVDKNTNMKYNELEATIAGVKHFGFSGKTRVDELGDIENLVTGITFKDCGGTSIKHLNRKPRIEIINGHETEIASAAVIVKSEKTIKDAVDIAESTNFIEWSVGDYEY